LIHILPASEVNSRKISYWVVVGFLFQQQFQSMPFTSLNPATLQILLQMLKPYPGNLKVILGTFVFVKAGSTILSFINSLYSSLQHFE
jgi:hypothetical protein